MPDIAMCQRADCLRAKDCYRFRAKPNPYRQSYMAYDPNTCESFEPIYDGTPPSALGPPPSPPTTTLEGTKE